MPPFPAPVKQIKVSGISSVQPSLGLCPNARGALTVAAISVWIIAYLYTIHMYMCKLLSLGVLNAFSLEPFPFKKESVK